MKYMNCFTVRKLLKLLNNVRKVLIVTYAGVSLKKGDNILWFIWQRNILWFDFVLWNWGFCIEWGSEIANQNCKILPLNMSYNNKNKESTRFHAILQTNEHNQNIGILTETNNNAMSFSLNNNILWKFSLPGFMAKHLSLSFLLGTAIFLFPSAQKMWKRANFHLYFPKKFCLIADKIWKVKC